MANHSTPKDNAGAHRRYAEWTPARMLAHAEKVGPSVAAFCEAVMADRPHPEQGFRTCLTRRITVIPTTTSRTRLLRATSLDPVM
jgi:hypothetical protein